MLTYFCPSTYLTFFAPKSHKGIFLPLFAANNAVSVPFRDGRAKIVNEAIFLLFKKTQTSQ